MVARGLGKRARGLALRFALGAILMWPAAGTASVKPPEGLSQLNEAFVAIAEAVTPGVVFITTETKVQRGLRRSLPKGHPLEEFFPFGPEPFRSGPRRGLGSGVVVSEDGYILTNNHVIEGADKITVTSSDKREFTARLVGADPPSDIAVVKIDAGAIKPAPMGDSDALRVGEWVVAIGNPFAFTHTVTAGIVSAKGRSSVINRDNYEDFIQTDAAINPGNSGGALVNIRGELVGINTAIATRSGSYQGIGFAIPINMAQRVMAALIEHGEVVRGWLGVMIQDIGEDLAQVLELSNRQGALVGEVVEDSPASEAGVEEGDVILEFDGSSVEDTNDLRNRVAATSPGKRAKLGVLRDGNRRTLTVAIGQLPAEYGGTQPRQPESRLGLVAQELTPDLAKLFRYKGKEGVLVSSVASGSPADDAGLRAGDIIREIDRATVEDVETYERLIREAEPGDTLLLLVRRTSGQLYLTLSVPEE